MAKRKVWLANNTQIEIVDASDFEALAAELAKLKDARAVRTGNGAEMSDLTERTLKAGYDIQTQQRDRIRELEAALREIISTDIFLEDAVVIAEKALGSSLETDRSHEHAR